MYEVIKVSGEFNIKLKNLLDIEGDFYYNYVEDGLTYDESFEFENLDEARKELSKHESEVEFKKDNLELENGKFKGLNAVSWVLINEEGEVLEFAPLKPIVWEITDEKYNTITISNKEYTDYLKAIKDCLIEVEKIEDEYKIFFD